MDIEVVGEAENGREALERPRSLKPDVVVMDIAMRELNGIDATREIVAEMTDVRVVALSMHSDSRYVSEMLAAGATGYLLKDCAFDELATAIRTVSEGRTFVSQGAADVVLDDYVARGVPGSLQQALRRKSPLAARARSARSSSAEGLSTKEIAARLP